LNFVPKFISFIKQPNLQSGIMDETLGGNVITKSIGLFKGLFTEVVTKVVVAVVILITGFIVGKILGRLTQRLLHELELDNILKMATGIKVSVEELIGHFMTYFIYFIAVVMALNQIGMTTTLLNMISGGIIILIIIFILLGIKDFVPNVLAGIFIHQKGLIKEGDKIKVKDIQGRVVHINLVDTRLETSKGDLIFIPNSLLIKNELIKIKKRKR